MLGASTTSSFPLRTTNSIAIGGRRQHTFALSSPNGDNEGYSDGGSSSSSSSSKSRRKQPRITDKNLYEILGANQSMSRTEIKRLYIILAKETHPDSSNTLDAVATDRFNEIAQAYTILSDTKTRRAYDRELAAQDFKEDIVKKAGEVAREYGPTARKFYDDFAIPLLRRTTATTLAGWSAVQEVTSEVTSERNDQQQQRHDEIDNANKGYRLSGATLSEVVKEVSEMERANGGDNSAGSVDFGKAFQRVIEAGRNATRQIDGIELQEKSMELRQRADETRAESMQVLEQLTEIKSERLRLTFHTSSATFTSTTFCAGHRNQHTKSTIS